MARDSGVYTEESALPDGVSQGISVFKALRHEYLALSDFRWSRRQISACKQSNRQNANRVKSSHDYRQDIFDWRSTKIRYQGK